MFYATKEILRKCQNWTAYTFLFEIWQHYSMYIIHMDIHKYYCNNVHPMYADKSIYLHLMLSFLLTLKIFQSKPQQISFAGSCAHAVKFQCLPETRIRWKSTAKKKKKHTHTATLYTQPSICHLSLWQHTFAQRCQHSTCGATEHPLWKLIRLLLHVVLCEKMPATVRLGQFFYFNKEQGLGEVG